MKQKYIVMLVVILIIGGIFVLNYIHFSKGKDGEVSIEVCIIEVSDKYNSLVGYRTTDTTERLFSFGVRESTIIKDADGNISNISALTSGQIAVIIVSGPVQYLGLPNYPDVTSITICGTSDEVLYEEGLEELKRR